MYTHGTPVFGFEGACIGVEGKAEMRRSSRTTASISNAAIRAEARAMEAENWRAVGIKSSEPIPGPTTLCPTLQDTLRDIP